jgi:hypothetical protein
MFVECVAEAPVRHIRFCRWDHMGEGLSLISTISWTFQVLSVRQDNSGLLSSEW